VRVDKFKMLRLGAPSWGQGGVYYSEKKVCWGALGKREKEPWIRFRYGDGDLGKWNIAGEEYLRRDIVGWYLDIRGCGGGEEDYYRVFVKSYDSVEKMHKLLYGEDLVRDCVLCEESFIEVVGVEPGVKVG
jgi:hypothetical protein